jgi:hypothetical protein
LSIFRRYRITPPLDQLESREPLFAVSDFSRGLYPEKGHRTAFEVLGARMGLGLAWHGPKRDEVWCIDATLRVYVRRRGRFLIEYAREQDSTMSFLLRLLQGGPTEPLPSATSNYGAPQPYPLASTGSTVQASRGIQLPAEFLNGAESGDESGS